MTQFEFVAGGVTIVLALSVARLLDGLRPAFERERRYGLYAAWVVIKLMNVPMMYWGGWVNRAGERDILEFVMLLVMPAILYLQASALVPSEPERVKDWAAHFWSIRRWFFSLNALLGCAVVANAALGRGIDARELAAAIVVAASLVGRVSTSERVHWLVALVIGGNLVLGFGFIMMTTGR